MSPSEENKALVRYYFDELEAGNLDVVDEVFAEEFTAEYDVVRSDIDDVSRDSMDAVLEELFTAFPDTSIASQKLFAEEDSVIFMQTWEATHQGEYRGIAPSGNEVSYEFWGRFVIEDEQIVHAEVIADEFRLFTQLGLELSIEGYRRLIETAPDPIVIADINTGRVLETNSAAESMLERPRKEIIGIKQQELLPPDPRYDDLFKEAISRGKDTTVSVGTFDDGSDIELLRDDGSRVVVEVSAQVVTLAEQTTLVCLFRDVSERRRREQRTQVLNRIFRHNLRNELGIISGLAEVLTEDLDGQAKDQANQIVEKANELTALGEKARLTDQITTGEKTESSRVSIRGAVDEVVADVADSYPESEIHTEFSEPVTVVTVRRPFIIALRETVENAVEHGNDRKSGHADSSSGYQSTVRISLEKPDDGQGVDIVVEDSGPGIPEHELTVIEEGQETALTHGSSIGLWLIHWGLNSIRGAVSFDTTGAGTTVTLRVPSLDK
jgi:PAS domain S-box-containing protein